MPPQAEPTSLLSQFPVVVEIPVQWGEMDAYGHVNNTAFFRYFETARIAYLDRCGFLDSYDQNRIGAILHSTECRFRRPVRHPDTVLVGARSTEIGEDRFTMGYRVVSISQEAIVAEGTGIIVSFDYTARKKTLIPGAVREGMRSLHSAAADGR